MGSNVSTRFNLLNSLWQSLAAVACCLSLISSLSPFLQTLSRYPGGLPESFVWPDVFWSFKNRYVIVGVAQPSGHGFSILWQERIFADYWSHRWASGVLGNWIGPSLTFMFGFQILTIAFGILAVIKKNRYPLMLSTLLDTSIILMMLFVYVAMEERYGKTFEIGFWLALLSTALFYLATIVNSKICHTSASAIVH